MIKTLSRRDLLEFMLKGITTTSLSLPLFLPKGSALADIKGSAANKKSLSGGDSSMSNKSKRREELYGLLGDLPERNRKMSVRKLTEQEKEGYILEKLVLDLNGIEPVPAYFVRPKNARGPFPVVLYNHAHFGDYKMGKDEFLLGRSAIQKPAYTEALTSEGYAALCIDTWAFGERRGRSESEIFKQMLWYGKVMWGMMVYDSLRAVDYLVSRPDIDSGRIATMGMSMGSTMSWWLAALDERIKVCIDICCLTDYDALIATQGLDRHGIYYYVPKLLKHFTSAQINALISPRPHLGLAGKYDRLTPLDGLNRINDELIKVYESDGAPEAWKLLLYDIGHLETAAMRQEILAFFKKWL